MAKREYNKNINKQKINIIN